MFQFLKSVLRTKPKKTVAVVTPIYRLPLSEEEQISLRHLSYFLNGFDRYIISPKSLPLDFPDFQTRRFEDSFFGGITGYNQLMLTPGFYETFSDYRYVLIYQLDCLVFSKDLEFWCRKQWDYVGAPWFQDYQKGSSGELVSVGNGGLSLRHVGHCLEALRRKNAIERLVLREVGQEVLDRNDAKTRVAVKKVLLKHGFQNDPKWFLGKPVKNEDLFWAFEAKQLMPKFHLPTPQEALAFSFEYAPQICFERNGSQLPFGCHAWARYDPGFWKHLLLQADSS